MPRYETIAIGTEGEVAVVIDDAVADPEALRAAAIATPFSPALHAYPGLRAKLPPAYWPAIAPVIVAATGRIGAGGAAPSLIDASFAIVTTPRQALSVAQRLPHCDAHDRGRVAFVHYLDPSAGSGGTAFYRHRSTRFETVDAERRPILAGQLDAELRYGGVPEADYAGAADRLFERIAVVPARFNRLVVYRSFLLHSGAIPADASLSPDPAQGRLTITGFLATG